MNDDIKFLTDIFESLPYPFYVINAANENIEMSNTAARSESEVTGMTCCSMLQHAARASEGKYSPNPIDVIKERKQPIVLEYKKKNSNGIESDIEIHGYPILDEQGHVSYVIEYCFDVTKRKYIEQQLQRASSFNEALLDTIPFGIDIVDQEGNILFMNDKFKNKFGALAADHRCWELYKDDKKQCEQCVLKHGVFPGETRTIETDNCLGGRSFQITHTGMLFDGERAILEIFEDITERKNTERRIKEAVAIKSQFISTVSHELRTPLTAIKGAINLVYSESTGRLNAEQKDFLETAQRNVDRLARLIDDVLDFQKLDSGNVHFHMKTNSLNEVVQEVHKIMVPLADEKKLSLLLQLNEQLPPGCFDKDKIIQVVTNLVHNAIKCTEKGAIILSTSHRGNVICCSIQDTGCGMEEQSISRIFHRFEQLGQKDDRKKGGTGLGLAISKEIVEKHEGKIWIESTIGAGTLASFVLPVKEYCAEQVVAYKIQKEEG